MSLLHGDPWVVPLTLVAGIGADVLYCLFQPEIQRTHQLRLFAVLVPVGLYSLYFLTLALLGGVWWPIPLWTGAIVLSGIVGWFVSYLVVPSVLPEAADHGASPAPVDESRLAH